MQLKLMKCKRVLNTARRDVSIVCGKIMRAEFDISKSDNESKNKSLNVIKIRESRYLKRLHTVKIGNILTPVVNYSSRFGSYKKEKNTAGVKIILPGN